MLRPGPRAFSTGDGWAHGHFRRPTPTDGHPEKTGHEQKSEFHGFCTFSVRFGPFLASLRLGPVQKAALGRFASIPPYMSPWRPLKHQIMSIFMFFDRHFVRLAPQFQRFLSKNEFLTKKLTPLDPSHKIRIKILHKMTCLSAPHHFFLDPFVTKTLFLFQTIIS